jgi:thiamine monophosphate synthase
MVFPMPVVAIGGINHLNATEVLNAGATAVAVISAVLANPSRIARNLQQIMSSIE